MKTVKGNIEKNLKYIEVKSTISNYLTGFYISENEFKHNHWLSSEEYYPMKNFILKKFNKRYTSDSNAQTLSMFGVTNQRKNYKK